MCKNLMVVGIKKDQTKKLWEFLKEVSPFMTSGGEKDGIGYAAMSPKGIWGERWTNPDEAWKIRKELSEQDSEIKKKFKGLLKYENVYNKFGTPDEENVFAVLLHARLATSEKGILNTHPFVRDDKALIHNGCISNVKELTLITSTCDSETILNEYVDEGVDNKPVMIKEVTGSLEGSYACGVLGETKDGREYLDIFRGTPPLVAIFIEELDAMVYATRPDVVKEAVEKLKWKIGNVFDVQSEALIRIDARTGELIDSWKFEVNKFNQYSEKHWQSQTGRYGSGYGGD